jgi:hypothetical protein
MKTKFELLEHVKHKIKGTFENEPIEVVKTLRVVGINILSNQKVNYRCYEGYDLTRGGYGREYSVYESELMPVESVVNAIASARAAEDTTLRNSGSLPLTAPAPANNAPSHDRPDCPETTSQP